MQGKIIAVIGGGAAGLAAAVTAARAGGVVRIYERGARVGRKLLATGNGRCNLSNYQAQAEHYHGEAPDFVKPALERFSVADTVQFFDSLGVMTVEEEEGRLYPRSLQASAVLDALRLECARLGVETVCDCAITAIRPLRRGGFTLGYAGGTGYAQSVIVAAGGAAGAGLGGTMAGYALLEDLGHHRTALLPAIVQLKCDTSSTRALAGVKIDALATLYSGGQAVAQRFDEVLFTEYGLSGPAIMALSTVATRLLQRRLSVSVGLDVTPELSEEALRALLLARAQARPEMLLENFTVGMLHKRLGQSTLKAAQIAPLSRMAGSLTAEEVIRYARLLKDWRIAVRETNGLGNAQVTAGGIVTGEFDGETLSSRLVPGLYAAGEVLDIDGECGGYNLQWAWSSGRLAGLMAVEGD